MKDKAKEQFRTNVYQLIEKMAGVVKNLKVEALKPYYCTREDDIPNMVQGYSGEVLYVWNFNYRLFPDDKNTQEFIATLSDIYATLNSREGVRMLPRGLYRVLIEFSDKCIARMGWKDGMFGTIQHHSEEDPPAQEKVNQEAECDMNVLKGKFLGEIQTMKREIFYFENERDESEESFFGNAGDKADS